MNTRHPALKVFLSPESTDSWTKPTCLLRNVHVNKIHATMRCVSCLEEFHESWLSRRFAPPLLLSSPRHDDSATLLGGIFARLNENNATSNYRVKLSTIPQILAPLKERDHGQRWKGVGTGKERMASFCRVRPWNSAILWLQDSLPSRSFVKSWNSVGIDDILILFALFRLSTSFVCRNIVEERTRGELLSIVKWSRVSLKYVQFKILGGGTLVNIGSVFISRLHYEMASVENSKSLAIYLNRVFPRLSIHHFWHGECREGGVGKNCKSCLREANESSLLYARTPCIEYNEEQY